MEPQGVHIPDLGNEFLFQASRSSGPGGQNVNKVNSRVELRFNIPQSALLTDEQKQILLTKLASKVTSEGGLVIASQEFRSQLKNKQLTEKKLYALLEKALRPVKKRRASSPSKAAIEKRLKAKKEHSEKKSQRGRIIE